MITRHSVPEENPASASPRRKDKMAGKSTKKRRTQPEPRYTVGSLNRLLDMRLATMEDGDLESLAAFVGRLGDRYSVRNRMRMWAQDPNATVVMGYKYWPEHGRHVRKGATGIAYLARRSRSKEEKERAAEAAGMDPRKAAERDEMAGVCVRYAFDISQTVPIEACDECGSGPDEECAPTCSTVDPLRDEAELADPYDVDELAGEVEAIKERAAQRARMDSHDAADEDQEHEQRRSPREGTGVLELQA